MSTPANPPISASLRAVTGVEVIVLALTGFGLFFMPSMANDLWPWSLAPFGTRFLGAIYLASFVPIAVMFAYARWSPARVVLPPLLAFTLIVLAVSLLNTDRFEFGRVGTWLWFALYLLLPANSAWHIVRYRRLGRAAQRSLPNPTRTIAYASGVAMGLYGLAMLAAPGTATEFWPWPIDAFHARMYSAPFVAGAIGLLLLPPRSTRAEIFTAAATQTVLGVLALAGLLVVDRTLRRVDYAELATWLWLAVFAALALCGVLLAITGLSAKSEGAA